jgi:transposase
MIAAPPLDPQTLPDDPAQLKAALIQMHGELQRLRLLLAQIRRAHFGRKTERLADGQRVLDFCDVIEPPPKPEPPTPPPMVPKKGHGRRVVPKDLPRVTIEHDVAEDRKRCGCGAAMVCIGADVAEVLDYEPSQMHVVEHRRLKYACPNGDGSVVVADPVTGPVEKGLAGPGLLAQVIVSKYADHLPLHRQSRIFLRQGATVSPSTLCDWVGRSMELLRPIAEAVARDVLASKVIRTDDTPVRVLEPGSAGSHTGRLWVYVGDALHAQTAYRFSPTHERKWPQEFFGDWAGYVQADAYKGYDALFVGGKRLEVGCWMHARRKFFEARETDAGRAIWMLGQIRELYRVEEEAKAMSAADRLELRRREAVPRLHQMHAWLDREIVAVLPKSPIGTAIQYARGNWAALMRYTEDADLSIDNGAAERALRGVAVGRKNYLFFGSEGGGERAAVAYTLIESCRRNGVEPWAYLRDVLTRISTHPADRIAELTPQNWKRLVEAPAFAEASADRPAAPASADTS